MPSKGPTEQIAENNPWYTVDHVSSSKQQRQRLVIADRIKFIANMLEEWREATYQQRGKREKLKLLDAGCGDGVLLEPLTHLEGFEVYGVDYSPIRVKRASENASQATVQQADLTRPESLARLGFTDGFFDAIVMSQVLEHIAQDASVLKYIATLLRDDGVFILGAPNEGCLLGRIRNRVLQPSIARTTDHVNFYTERDMVHKLAQAGFAVDKIDRTGFFFPHEAINICLASWNGGYKIAKLLGRAVKSQVASHHFVCYKGASTVARQLDEPAEPLIPNPHPIYQERIRGQGKYAKIEHRDCKIPDIEELHERIGRRTGAWKIVSDWSLTKIEDTNFKLLEPHLDGKRVLEVGCGRGYLTALISNRTTVAASDISRGCLDYARKIGNFSNITFAFQGNVCSIPFKSSTFDVVVASEILEHLPDLNRAMTEINRVLKDGGIVVASVPNTILHLYPLVLLGHLIVHGPRKIVDLLRRRTDDGPMYHRPFLPGQLRHLFKQNGFSILSHRTTMLHFWHFPYMQLVQCGEKIHARATQYLVKQFIEKTDAALDRGIPLVRWIGARQHILAQKQANSQQCRGKVN